jgi:hypothetical protein
MVVVHAGDRISNNKEPKLSRTLSYCGYKRSSGVTSFRPKSNELAGSEFLETRRGS